MLRDFILEQKDVLWPCGDLDDLGYYACCAERLAWFLNGKEIAAKNHLPNPKGIPVLLKRGSFNPSLFIQDFECVDVEFLEKRAKLKHLKDARDQLTGKQQLVWGYFLPSKLADFLYATNGESPGKPLERVFIDFDRGKGVSAENARQAVSAFVESTRDYAKKEFKKTIITWTGNSFHVFLFPEKPLPPGFYEGFGKGSESTLNAWIKEAQKNAGVKMALGHEKKEGQITVDPSQTPSGKLCRAPFSLHLKEANTVDGVCVPITQAQLAEENLTKHLSSLTPRAVLEKIDAYANLL